MPSTRKAAACNLCGRLILQLDSEAFLEGFIRPMEVIA